MNHPPLQEIRLRDFRCFPSIEWKLDAPATCITGANAQGKTSLLEAVCVLLRLQSPRTTSTNDLARVGTPGFGLQGLWQDHSMAVRQDGDGRRLTLESKPGVRSSDYLALARVTWFSNSDQELVVGGGSTRRRYLDFLGVQTIPAYRKCLRDYERALRSRNLLLKENRPRREVAGFDTPLVENGLVLMQERTRLVEALRPHAAFAAAWIGGNNESLSIDYQPGAAGTFSDALVASRAEEERLRQTVCGPHRDDIGIFLNGLPAGTFASEGQQRTIALSLKIAQARHIESSTGQPPLLLLDDIFGELDPGRRNRLLGALPPKSQSILATTFLDWIEPDFPMRVWTLSGGGLRSLS